jgi:uncharacterized protein
MGAGSMLLHLGRAGHAAAHQEGTLEIVVCDAASVEETHRLHVECRLEDMGPRLRVQGEVQGQAQSHCHRCLGAFERPVETSFSVLLQRGGTAEAEEVVLLPENTETYDLTPVVREAVILEEPIVLVCRDDCKGLCAQCGQNLNVGSCDCSPPEDPRWEALRKLVEPQEPRGDAG